MKFDPNGDKYASAVSEADKVSPATDPPPVGDAPPFPTAEGDHSGTAPVDAADAADAADSAQKLLDSALSADPFYSGHLDQIARDLLRQLAPQDPAEQMLVTQMIATFTRSMFLSKHANRQKNAKWFALYSGECDRAMNLYRKQMTALADYRRPRRTVFNAIRTANIAGQQVVLTGSRPRPKRSKPRPAHAEPPPPPASLPPVPPRQSRVAEVDPKQEALAHEPRPPHP